MMRDGAWVPQINLSSMPVSGGLAGGIFTAGSMAIFLIGIPALRYFLPAAAILGGGVALALHFKRPETPGKAWIPSSTKK